MFSERKVWRGGAVLRGSNPHEQVGYQARSQLAPPSQLFSLNKINNTIMDRSWVRYIPTRPNKHNTMSLIGITHIQGFGSSEKGYAADVAREVKRELRRRGVKN